MLRDPGIVLQRWRWRLHTICVSNVVRIRFIPSVASMSGRLCLLLQILELRVSRVRGHRRAFGMAGMPFFPFGNVLITT